MHLFIFGLGYTSTILAKQLLAKGWRVSGTCRTAEKCDRLKPLGITPYIFDNDLPLDGVWDFSEVTHVLHSVPPTLSARGEHEEAISTNLQKIASSHSLQSAHRNDETINSANDIVFNYHLEELKNLPNLQWFGYLSTTGVYGDHGGAWVDESTPTNPFNERSQWRVDAENAWLESGLPTHIFRLSGIYGPGSSAIDDVRNGTARRINKPGQVFSRIHVEDIAQILEASMARPNHYWKQSSPMLDESKIPLQDFCNESSSGDLDDFGTRSPLQASYSRQSGRLTQLRSGMTTPIYNCADDHPCAQAEVVEYAAKLLGVEPPPLVDFETADLSPMARSFYACNRRVSNKKIKDELGVTLKYKDYRSGLDNEIIIL